MYIVKKTNQFKKDYKNAIKRGYDKEIIIEVVKRIANEETLPEKYRDHSLTGNWKNYRECHITPDWLLIYRIDKNIMVLTLTRTGSHSDIF